AFAAVNTPFAGGSFAVEISADVRRFKRHAFAQSDRIEQNLADSRMQKLRLFSRNAVRALCRMKPRTEHRLGRVNVAESGDLCLIEEKFFQRTARSFQLREKIFRTEFVAERFRRQLLQFLRFVKL